MNLKSIIVALAISLFLGVDASAKASAEAMRCDQVPLMRNAIVETIQHIREHGKEAQDDGDSFRLTAWYAVYETLVSLLGSLDNWEKDNCIGT